MTELVDHLDVIGRLDRAIGPIKQRRRGPTGGQPLVGIAAAQLAGEDSLVGWTAGAPTSRVGRLAPVPGVCGTTAAGLARRFHDGQWAAAETGLGDVAAAALAVLPADRAAAL